VNFFTLVAPSALWVFPFLLMMLFLGRVKVPMI